MVGEEEALPDGLALLVIAAAPARPHATLALGRQGLPAAAAAAAASQDLLHQQFSMNEVNTCPHRLIYRNG